MSVMISGFSYFLTEKTAQIKSNRGIPKTGSWFGNTVCPTGGQSIIIMLDVQHNYVIR